MWNAWPYYEVNIIPNAWPHEVKQMQNEDSPLQAN